MKISIVTAVYNRRATLGQALDSVATQNHPDIEHVIQDGGSTDGTCDVIIAKKDPRIALVSTGDDGIYDAINRGIRRTNGDVIGLMHSDDFFATSEILSTVAKIMQNPNIDGVYGDLDYVAASDTARIIRRWRSGSYDPKRLNKGWMPPHPTLYLRRAVFEQHGLYDTSFRIAADYDAMLRYLVKGQIKLAYIPAVMVKMRVGGESNKSVRKILQKSWEDYRAIRRNEVGGVYTLALKNLSKLQQFL